MNSDELFLVVAFCYRDLRKEYHPYYNFGEMMNRRHRLAKHFLNTADVIIQLNVGPRVYIAAQFSRGEVPLPHQLYSKRAIKRYEDFVSSRIPVGDPDQYAGTLARAWKLSIEDARRMFSQWL